MFEVEGAFWLNLLILFIVFFVVIYLFELVVRKILNLERRKIFSYNHINKIHERIDWSIRISFIFILLAAYIFSYYYSFWYIQPYIILVIFIVVSGIARAILEFKYVPNRKEALFTILQLVFHLLLFGGVVWIASTGWFGWIKAGMISKGNV